ncbi:MAG: hypothetical protein OHK0029_17350 [Armatimonadaceae bacterium]
MELDQNGGGETTEPDYYALLGVSPDAGPEEVRRVYGEKIRHAQSDTERFALLTGAYDILKDPAKRAAYDRRRANSMRSGHQAEKKDSYRMSESELALAVRQPTQMGSPAAPSVPLSMDNSLPTICAMNLTPCPLLRGEPADDGFCSECGYQIGSPLGDAAAQRPMPKLMDVQGREYALKVGENVVGREGADVMLPHNTVSRRHAMILVDEQGNVSLEDTGSTNGTRISGSMIPKRQRTGLRDQQVVQFGAVRLTLIAPEVEDELLPLPPADTEEQDEELFAIEAPAEQQTRAELIRKDGGEPVILMAERVTFGRRADNTVVLTNDSYASGSHAEITYQNGNFLLQDLGSTNGTKINGARLPPQRTQKLKDGDTIMMGQTEFTFRAPNAG